MKNFSLYSNFVREPAFAGRFYPSSKEQLMNQLVNLFATAKEPVNSNPPRAIISPHAGYVFSGQVAASAFNQLTEKATFKRVFVLASSHRYSSGGASVCNANFYKTPLGDVKVDTEVIRNLLKSDRLIKDHFDAHQYEHSLEVQLPFLQYKLGMDFQLVPIILETHELAECENIASILNPWFNSENLFVVSTDFSHYPAYDEAVEHDFNTALAICSNNPLTLMKNLKRTKNIHNLVTSLCGWSSVATLVYLTHQKNMDYRLIHYQNSGDSLESCDKDRVVGYWAMAVYEKHDELYVSRQVQTELLEKARHAILHFVESGCMIPLAPFPCNQTESAGMFVSIYVKGALRGCIGNLTNLNAPDDEVEHLAISAFCDQRFEHVKKDELQFMELEISMLSPLRKINSIDEIELGRHGVYIVNGSKSGTFLPEVAIKTGWNINELMGHCAQDKAGIGWDGWRDAEIYVYEAFVFRG